MNGRFIQMNIIFSLSALLSVLRSIQQLDYKNMVHFSYCILHLENWILHRRSRRRRRV